MLVSSSPTPQEAGKDAGVEEGCRVGKWQQEARRITANSNTVIAGFFTGGALAIRGGMKAARNSAIGCGILLAVIEGVGIGIQRMMAENTRIDVRLPLPLIRNKLTDNPPPQLPAPPPAPSQPSARASEGAMVA